MANNADKNVMDSAAAPVVEDASLPEMPLAGDTAGEIMETGAGAPSPGLGSAEMPEPAPSPEVDEESASYGDEESASYGDMEGPVAAGAPGGDYMEGYLRLVIDVDDGELTLVDAAVIDGPVVFSDLTGQMAYDAVVHGRRVAADAFDDLAVRHSFPPPDSPETGHGEGQTSHYQFVARVPRSEVTLEELADLEVTLMRPPSTRALAENEAAAPGMRLEDAAAAAGGEQPEIVGRLHGVDLEQLGGSAAEAVQSRLR